jgi:hypothetical protein
MLDFRFRSHESRLPTVGSIELHFRGAERLDELKAKHGIGEMKLDGLSVTSKSRLLLIFHDPFPESGRDAVGDSGISPVQRQTAAIVADVDWTTGNITDSLLVNFGVLRPKCTTGMRRLMVICLRAVGPLPTTRTLSWRQRTDL